MMKRLFIISIIFLISNPAFNQITDSKVLNLFASVKQLNELINRFNYVSDNLGNKLDDEFKTVISRENYILSLFNFENELLNDSSYQNTINKFIAEVCDTLNPLFLKRFSEGILAELECPVIIENREKLITLYLLPEIGENGSYKWIIKDIKTDLYQHLEKRNDTLVFINPLNNETGFISLQRIFTEKTIPVSNYTTDDFTIDKLSLFFNDIYTNRIKFTTVKNCTYYIFDIDGWVLEVEEFIRDKKNSGWLINNLQKKDITVTQFLDQLE